MSTFVDVNENELRTIDGGIATWIIVVGVIALVGTSVGVSSCAGSNAGAEAGEARAQKDIWENEYKNK